MTFRRSPSFTPTMDENESTPREMTQPDITRRLRALGEAEVPDPARSEHLRRMAATPAEPSRGFGRAWVAAAAIVGFLAGSTGLAAAGALPDPAQDVAHDVLSVVQVDVPEGKRGPCVSAIAKGDLPEGDKKAAKDACPKGGKGGDVDGDGTPGRSGNAPGGAKHAEDPCKGKPPWAGKNQLTEAQRDAMKAERAAECERGLDDAEGAENENEAEAETEELEETEAPETQRREPVTTTTVAPTTTAAPTTTEAPTTTAASDETTTTTEG